MLFRSLDNYSNFIGSVGPVREQEPRCEHGVHGVPKGSATGACMREPHPHPEQSHQSPLFQTTMPLHTYSLHPSDHPTACAAVLSPPPVSACIPILCPIPLCHGGWQDCWPRVCNASCKSMLTCGNHPCHEMDVPCMLIGAAAGEHERV